MRQQLVNGRMRKAAAAAAAASERTTDRGVTDLSQRMDGGAEGGTGVTDLINDSSATSK